ncbi:MAG: hypothetical protein ACFFDV_06850 [Candidatus Thorarchaeota archaeon]
MKEWMSLIFLLVLMMIPATAVIPSNYELERSFCEAEVDVENVLEDVEFMDPVNFYTHGTSTEFSGWQSDSERDGNYGFVELIWTHESTNNLTWNGAFSEDYIYFNRSFTWLFKDRPRNIVMNIDFGISMTGDFSISTDYSFVVLKGWLVDMYDNEASVYGSFSMTPGYYQSSREISPYAIEQDLNVEFGDTLTLYVALIPTASFQGLEGSHDGTITATIRSLDLALVNGTPVDSEDALSPVLKGKWESTRQNLIDFPSDADLHNVGDIFNDIVLGPDNSVFTVGESRSETYSIQDTVLIKWNEYCTPLWVERIGNTGSRGIAASEDAVFTAGYDERTSTHDILIVKWSLSGSIVWETTHDLGNEEIAKGIDVGSDGSVFIITEQYENWGTWNSLKSSLLKFNSDGNFMWNRTLAARYAEGIYALNSSRIYTLSSVLGDILQCWDFDGNELWNMTDVLSFDVDLAENIYTTFQFTHDVPQAGERTDMVISKYNQQRELIWNYTLGRTYSYVPVYNEHLSGSISVENDGSVVVLARLYKYASEHELIKFYRNGTLVLEKVIGNEFDRSLFYAYGHVVSSNGLTYVMVQETYRTGDYTSDSKLALYGYATGDYVPPLIPPELMNYVIVGGIAIAAIAIIVVLKKKR